MSAIVPISGAIRQLDRAAQPDELVTPERAKDAEQLSRLLMRLLRDVASIQRLFWPTFLDFEDQSFDSTGTKKFRFEHGFGGRVRFWLVDCTALTGVAAPCLVRHADTDDNTLVLVSNVACTGTLRVEAAG